MKVIDTKGRPLGGVHPLKGKSFRVHRRPGVPAQQVNPGGSDHEFDPGLEFPTVQAVPPATGDDDLDKDGKGDPDKGAGEQPTRSDPPTPPDAAASGSTEASKKSAAKKSTGRRGPGAAKKD